MTPCVHLFFVILLTYIVPSFGTPQCQFNYTYTQGMAGNFSSPYYPDEYPSMLRCAYYFGAASNGGVEIKFLSFDLEDKKEGDDNCRYDYIDVFTVDTQGFMTFLNRFCGRKIPHTITSPQSRLLIKFVTDHWKSGSIGFFGTYSFLGDEYQPFDSTGPECGNTNVTGVSGFISSPDYPQHYPTNVNCTWTIRVASKHHIVIRIQELDVGANISDDKCSDSMLHLYNGYATVDTLPTREWCGVDTSYSHEELKYISFTNKTTIRFISGPKNTYKRQGFKLMWMAVTLPTDLEPCEGFRCKGGRYCHNGVDCTDLTKFCIDKSLVCDGVQQCGPYDDSDERKCTREIVIMVACIAVPSLVLIVMMLVMVIYCQKRRHVSKSTSQEQPLANSTHSHGTTSRDSVTSNRQMILHTSFMDGCHVNGHDNGECKDIDDETTNGLYSDSATIGSLRTHKKRPSYHMMQLNHEGDNLLVASI